MKTSLLVTRTSPNLPPRAARIAAYALAATLFMFTHGARAGVTFDGKAPEQVGYGMGKLSSALTAAGSETEIELRLAETGAPESYTMTKGDGSLVITGTDAGGLMYGALGLAEAIRNGTPPEKMEPMSETARFPFRAIKFNVPWDAYRQGEASSLHLETARDLAFWESFLDMMAENRFNTLTLWNPHPFNYMIRAKNFPEACDLTEAELAEWQAFWHGLFKMADERNVDVYIVNWNIIVSEAFAKAHNKEQTDGARTYGEALLADEVDRYMRESVTQVLKEYPRLDGLGVSLGDRMGTMTPEEREQWILDVIVQGMQDAERPVKLIHRVPFSASTNWHASTSVSTEQMTRDAMENIEGIELPIHIEIKFNWSHAHSTPDLVQVHGGSISDAYWNPPPRNYKIAWMVRNEDFYCLRWGNPDFIRQHIARNGQDYVGGYFLGSECYVPAKDYFQQPGLETPWTYAFERQWYYYKIWGRLLYNPDTPDAVFAADFDRRFGNDGKALREALELGSRMPLRLASLVMSTWDFTLYSEGFVASRGPAALDESSPFISVEELAEVDTLAPDYVSIKDFVAKAGKGFPTDAVTPPKLADRLEEDGKRILELTEKIGPAETGSALAYEMVDARAWAFLSLYFSEKIRGGIALKIYRAEGADARKEEAIVHLTEALEYWDELVALTRPIYRDMPVLQIGGQFPSYYHWALYRDQVKRDIDLVSNPVLFIEPEARTD